MTFSSQPALLDVPASDSIEMYFRSHILQLAFYSVIHTALSHFMAVTIMGPLQYKSGRVYGGEQWRRPGGKRREELVSSSLVTGRREVLGFELHFKMDWESREVQLGGQSIPDSLVSATKSQPLRDEKREQAAGRGQNWRRGGSK